MKSVSLLSGGKDSFFATLIAMEQGLEITECVTVEPVEFSEMFHFPNFQFAKEVGELLGLKTVFLKEDSFYSGLKEIIEKDGIQAVISGALASNFQKTRIERFCSENNVMSYTPLWLMDQENELRGLIGSGIKAMIISVSAEGLGKEFLGREFNEELIEDLKRQDLKIRINLSGEGGEYESFVTGYRNKFLKITDYEDDSYGSLSFRRIKKLSKTH